MKDYTKLALKVATRTQRIIFIGFAIIIVVQHFFISEIAWNIDRILQVIAVLLIPGVYIFLSTWFKLRKEIENDQNFS